MSGSVKGFNPVHSHGLNVDTSGGSTANTHTPNTRAPVSPPRERSLGAALHGLVGMKPRGPRSPLPTPPGADRTMRLAHLPLQGAQIPKAAFLPSTMANAALHMAQAAPGVLNAVPGVLNAAHQVGAIVQPQVQSVVNSLQTTSQIEAMHKEASDTMRLQQAASNINRQMTFLSMLTEIAKTGMQNAKDALK
jgi:hypothetical protein